MSKYKKVGGILIYELHINGELVATIEKADSTDDETVVTLACGHQSRFWRNDLTDEEYVDRAEFLKHNT